jgi:hypothetical protein
MKKEYIKMKRSNPKESVKYVIYEASYKNGAKTLRYGKLQPSDIDLYESHSVSIRVVQEYPRVQMAASEFHMMHRINKEIMRLYTRSGNPLLLDVAQGVGWPETPVVDMAISRLQIAQQLYNGGTSDQKEELDQRMRLAEFEGAASLNKIRQESRQSKISPLTDEDFARSSGFTRR